MNTGVEIITAIDSRSTSSSARPGSHVSISTVVIALVTGSRTPYVRPATCVTGIGSSSDSPARISCAAAIVSASTRSDWCVCTTPFGSEVVPDVHRIDRGIVDVDRDARAPAVAGLARERLARRAPRGPSPAKPARADERRIVGAAERRAARRRAARSVRLEDEADLVRAERRRDRARDRAAAPDRPAQHDRFPPVRQLPRDDVARPTPRSRSARRDAAPTGARRSSTVRRTSPSTIASVIAVAGGEPVEQRLVGPDVLRAPARPDLGGRGMRAGHCAP